MTNDLPLKWEEFQRVEMRVGTVISAEEFPEARNSAYKLHIDFGPWGIKRSSAQITDLYHPQELIGKQVIAVVNFAPKQIANMRSECLVLGAVGMNSEVSLLSVDRVVENGTRIG
ncbi:Protein secretion chaperonin CsaA [Lunatimonas lonarensis]|uniref:Protein secretion chaperonin CsaA n=1 Tax=Lunatimonas lonarensis TaxID=1232681 RepID=R7ZUQ4_9BACT|nr:tRNA-binding protein [Lunatimonas lonarensis]EON77881.1 Protein secretion chaperonin CsaA [Lunatimonas lonarensis]